MIISAGTRCGKSLSQNLTAAVVSIITVFGSVHGSALPKKGTYNCHLSSLIHAQAMIP